MATQLFGPSPLALQQAQQANLQERASQYAQLNPLQRASQSLYQAGSNLGGGIAGLMGVQDPAMKRQSDIAAIVSKYDIANPEDLAAAAKDLMAAGFQQEASLAIGKANELAKAQADIEQVQAKTQQEAAAAQAAQYKIDQEKAMTAELAALPPEHTNADIIKIATKYGSLKDVLQVTQQAADKQAAREQALTLAREAAQNRIDAAKEAGASRLQIAQLTASTKTELAKLATALKGPSPAELKRQDAIDKATEGKASLSDTLAVASSLINELKKSGGMSSTASSGLSNMLTKFQTSSTGQYAGQVFGTENQKNRDVLESTRLQLLNAVKQATGMGSAQLNSNVELQTWLNSLGAPGSTAEANQEILNNISQAYLRQPLAQKPESAPKTPIAPLTGNALVDKYLNMSKP